MHIDRRYMLLLRQAGFKPDGRIQISGISVRLYKKVTNGKEIEIQLWSDGSHTASHGLRRGFRYKATTKPTGFSTVSGMLQAIINEASRTDAEPLDG